MKLEYPTPDGREQANVVPVDNMMQAFYYTHHIQASELALDVVQPSPYRMSVDFDVANELPFSYANEHIPIKIIVDKEPGFNEPIEIVMGVKHRFFSLEPITILPEEKEKIIYLKLNHTALERFRGRKNPPSWQMNIVGTVKGEITKQGKRTFQNAKYREITPYFVLKLAR